MSIEIIELRQRLRAHGQEHVLAWWGELSDVERRILADHLKRIDLAELLLLYQEREQKIQLPTEDRIVPLPRPEEGTTPEIRMLGEAAFRGGEIAFLVVAGGQGSRLGFDHPKGMFPVGPVSGNSLFQIHAEKVLALRRRYQAALPLLVMTSPATHEETLDFFKENRHFGLPADDVGFFQQGVMPALDLATGRLLLEGKGNLFLGPNGHGGTLTGLAESGLLQRLQQRGIRTVYYFQVDNPLVKLADVGFIGRHLAACAEVSSKVLPKAHPLEKVGNFVLLDGRCAMIEYSDLPEALARQTDEQGRPRLWAGNPAIHLFDVAFLQKVTATADRIPWHVARKKVPYVNEQGQVVEPAEENALKFERFIFDVLPQADRWTVQETTRAEEFEPLKNATGPDSPATVKAALSNQAVRWLSAAGVHVPVDHKGIEVWPLEISPLFALDAEELAKKVSRDLRLASPRYFHEEYTRAPGFGVSDPGA